MEWNEIFLTEESVSLDELNDGDFFAVPGTNQVNRYWTSDKNDFRPYMSPVICKKISSDRVQELMTDYPVPSYQVAASKRSMKVIPVKFIG